MKRRDLLQHLTLNGCQLLREGGSHSWWHNLARGNRSSVPRHAEIDNNLVRKICKDLAIPAPERL